MEPHVFMAVIAGAAMHAGWNAVLKIRLDPFLAVVLVNGACAVIALPIALYLGVPELHVWPWIVAALLLHLLYYLTLTGANRRADMGLVYPFARARVLRGERDARLIANDVMVHIRRLETVAPAVEGRITLRY